MAIGGQFGVQYLLLFDEAVFDMLPYLVLGFFLKDPLHIVCVSIVVFTEKYIITTFRTIWLFKYFSSHKLNRSTQDVSSFTVKSILSTCAPEASSFHTTLVNAECWTRIGFQTARRHTSDFRWAQRKFATAMNVKTAFVSDSAHTTVLRCITDSGPCGKIPSPLLREAWHGHSACLSPAPRFGNRSMTSPNGLGMLCCAIWSYMAIFCEEVHYTMPILGASSVVVMPLYYCKLAKSSF